MMRSVLASPGCMPMMTSFPVSVSDITQFVPLVGFQVDMQEGSKELCTAVSAMHYRGTEAQQGRTHPL